MFSNKAIACLHSASCPPVRMNLIGIPNASQSAWILQLNPPLDRPSASFSALLLAAPAAQACALMTVPSIETSCKSASSEKWPRSLPHAPLAHQRENRLKMLFHLPCSGGKTRHCEPERNIHKQALMNCLHVSGRPIWMPGNFFNFANIRLHSSSLNSIRFMPSKSVNSTLLVKRQQNLGKYTVMV